MNLRAFNDLLHRPVDPRALALFRMVVGAILLFEIIQYLDRQLIEMGIVGPQVLFPYEGFEWLRPLSLGGMKALFGSLCVAAVLMVVGLFTRWAAAYFFMGFLYTLLLDKGYFNNHLYLFALLAFLLAVVPSNRVWSLDRRFFGSTMPTTVPYWSWLLLRMQVVIVYFYGGVVKMTSDWLVRHEPVRTLLEYEARDSAMPELWTSDVVLHLFVYGGLLFDLSIGPLLWWKRTRLYALPLVLFFNITNHMIFDDIGVFPFFMIAATLLFFDPDEIARVFSGRATGTRNKRDKNKQAQPVADDIRWRPLVNAGLAAYLTFQLLFPLRWMLLPGDVDWTTIGQRFSWRMKATSREPQSVRFFVVDQRSGDAHPVDIPKFINNHQAKLCAFDPRATVRFAKWLKEEAGRRGMNDVRITSNIIISYNGRPLRYLWPTDQDLAAVEVDLRNPDAWVPPLEAPELELKGRELENLQRMRATPIGPRR